MWRLLAILLIGVGLASGVSAQQTPDHGRALGGRLRDASARLVASDIAHRLGLSCDIVRTRFRGQTENSSAMYEVVCGEGGGYVLIGAPDERAVDCLALESGPREGACRLPGSTDARAVVRRYAVSAGLSCPVDEGRVVGVSADGSVVYEAGCRGQSGAWLSETQAGWQAIDCLRIEARGNSCSLTTEAERLASLSVWVGSEICRPQAYRYMGESGPNVVLEISCPVGEGYVVRLGAFNAVREIIPCSLAETIGDGCRFRPGRDPVVQ